MKMFFYTDKVKVLVHNCDTESVKNVDTTFFSEYKIADFIEAHNENYIYFYSRYRHMDLLNLHGTSPASITQAYFILKQFADKYNLIKVFK